MSACPHCGYVEVNRFGSCMCHTQVKQLDGTWKYVWEMERERAAKIGRRCKCGNYEPGVDDACRWCNS